LTGDLRNEDLPDPGSFFGVGVPEALVIALLGAERPESVGT